MEKKWSWGRCLYWLIRKGRSSRENLVRGQDQERGAPPLDRQTEKKEVMRGRMHLYGQLDRPMQSAGHKKARGSEEEEDGEKQEQSQSLKQ